MVKGTPAPATAPDDVDDLFATEGKLSEDQITAGLDEMDDLLNEVEEDDSEAWVPTERGEGIQGVCIGRGEVRSDFAAKGEDPMVPTFTVQTKDGTKLRVIGYSKVLKDKIHEHDPQKGDLVAVKYFGEKPIKKGPYAGKSYKHYEMIVRKARVSAG
jgi:hypothetical protein